MVLILSNEYDNSTTHVIKWLDFYNKKWIRVNSSDKITLECKLDEFLFIIGKNEFLLSEITSHWYRRGYLNINFLNFNKNDGIFRDLKQSEMKKIVEYIYYHISFKIPSLNNIFKSEVNKLIVSDKARKNGLKTPNDFLISNFKFLDKIKTKSITKLIEGDIIGNDKYDIFTYTSDISNIEYIDKTIFPSLIQNYIDKKIEIRSFYIKGNFFSMAIFSQNDTSTTLDFRNYNKTKPNRTVSFKLPKDIEKKISKLLKKLKINCCSIDLIMNKNNEFYFLEINPIGQFGMVSYPCNYNLEEVIALNL